MTLSTVFQSHERMHAYCGKDQSEADGERRSLCLTQRTRVLYADVYAAIDIYT